MDEDRDEELEQPIDGKPCRQQIREDAERVSGLLVPVVFGLALDSGDLAAFMGISIRHDCPCIKLDLCIQPAISVRRILEVILTEQPDRSDQVPGSRRRIGQGSFQ